MPRIVLQGVIRDEINWNGTYRVQKHEIGPTCITSMMMMMMIIIIIIIN